MPYTIGSYTLPSSEQPHEGEEEWSHPQNWSKFEPIGAGQSGPGTLLTYISSPSSEQRMKLMGTDATRNALMSIFEARATVTWITPDNPTGYLVQMTELKCVHNRNTRGTRRWEIWMTLVKAQ